MIIEYPWSSYNHRRYGTPWAAAIKFEGVKPVYEFIGRFASGHLAFEAEPGDIVAMGQKDHRGNNTEKFFVLVTDHGGVEPITEAAARKLHHTRRIDNAIIEGEAMLAARAAMKTQDELIAEVESLREVNAVLVTALERLLMSDGTGNEFTMARGEAKAALAHAKGGPV